MSQDAAPSKILGAKVAKPTKGQLAAGIAAALGLDNPPVSSGASVDSTFLDRVHKVLTDDGSTAADAYRKAERVLQDLGLTYDPFWDTSESAEKGGSTVTNRAYSRMRAAITRTPRCFLLNVSDAEVGARWETDHHLRYRYDSTVTAHRPLNDAGPGSRVIYYSTSKSRQHPKHFVAHAEVSYIGPGWTGPWEATIANYSEFTRPVPGEELEMPGWNHQHAITEITYETYSAILRAAAAAPLVEAASDHDPGGDVVAARVIDELPMPEVAPLLVVPPVLPSGPLTPPPAAIPNYTEGPPGTSVFNSDLPPSGSNSRRNKLAETRGISLAQLALEADGWALKRDCQRDGVGFDLLFAKADRELHVEVKGVMASKLAFNLTPKESWRVEWDNHFVVVAVTNVLSPTAFRLHLLTRAELIRARRVITGYRLNF
ncbi:protein NO VEIN domain-containing protein [Thalassiella azotivora]